MGFDIANIRGQYPALADGRAWLDSAAGTQVPQSVIDAIAETYRVGVSNQGAPFEASRRSTRIVDEARAAVADLVGAADPSCVVFGPSMTALTYRFAKVLASGWKPGDELVVTQLDHDANVRPWVQAARDAGVTVRTATLDTETGELPAERVTSLLSERTRLVACTAASNLLGSYTDVPRICTAVREAGALSYVDGVHHCPHAAVDLAELGADFYATSAYKWTGPHVAALVARDPVELERLHPDKLLPAPEAAPDRFELGTSPFASLAGVTAAVEHLAGLDPSAAGTRRERLATSRRAAVEYESELSRALFAGLTALGNVIDYGPSVHRRAPTALFRLANLDPPEVAEALAARGVNVSHGHSYAWEATGALGIRDRGGAVRASLCHYNDHSDVDRLLMGVREIMAL